MRQHSNHLRRLHSIGSILLFLIASNAAAVAQEEDAVDVVKVNTDLVVFDVQVIDKKTKSVLTDLTEADFEIFDRGKKQTVTYSERRHGSRIGGMSHVGVCCNDRSDQVAFTGFKIHHSTKHGSIIILGGSRWKTVCLVSP
jgi:hypothetical protein